MLEKVVACAFRDSRDGKIYISRMCHAEIIGMFFGAQDKETSHRCEQGFITNLDRFVDRKEALQIARNAKQELHKWCDTDELYSEDIFWNPFEEENEENKKAFENFKNYSKKIFDDYEEMFAELQEQEKLIELMAEYIYNKSDTLSMLDIFKELDYDLQKLFNGIEDKEVIKIIIEFFKKKVSDKNK
ncbi:MAG: hypothetical protein J6C46_11515 [Clostridia bacterium]|nr:hypothetical protein [Clostridia bacterium]